MSPWRPKQNKKSKLQRIRQKNSSPKKKKCHRPPLLLLRPRHSFFPMCFFWAHLIITWFSSSSSSAAYWPFWTFCVAVFMHVWICLVFFSGGGGVQGRRRLTRKNVKNAAFRRENKRLFMTKQMFETKEKGKKTLWQNDFHSLIFIYYFHFLSVSWSVFFSSIWSSLQEFGASRSASGRPLIQRARGSLALVSLKIRLLPNSFGEKTVWSILDSVKAL